MKASEQMQERPQAHSDFPAFPKSPGSHILAQRIHSKVTIHGSKTPTVTDSEFRRKSWTMNNTENDSPS